MVRALLVHRLLIYRLLIYRLRGRRLLIYRLLIYRLLRHRLLIYRLLGCRLLIYRLLGCRLLIYWLLGCRLLIYRLLGCRLLIYGLLGCRLLICWLLGLGLLVHRLLRCRLLGDRILLHHRCGSSSLSRLRGRCCRYNGNRLLLYRFGCFHCLHRCAAAGAKHRIAVELCAAFCAYALIFLLFVQRLSAGGTKSGFVRGLSAAFFTVFHFNLRSAVIRRHK